jgi:cellulose synthase/poly-beta-1,6-N-acetylglucosamine synthase-like glycosyltransferase
MLSQPDPVKKGIYTVEGSGLPMVDLVILTCKEPVDVIMDTILSCTDLDYPKDKLRITVADDGKDDALEAKIKTAQRLHKNLLYHRRIRKEGVHHGFKAGNINDTLKWLSTQEGGAYPWVFNLDSDMILDREALKVLLGSALQDPKIGLATLPQVCRQRYVVCSANPRAGLL